MPLHIASINGRIECIEVLIDHGANKSIANVRHPSLPSIHPFSLSLV